MPWYLYIVKCADNSYYTGITTDLKRRVEMHNTKTGAKSLYGKLPVSLIYQELYKNRAEAGKRESEIKSWTRSKKEALVKSLI